MALPKTKLVLTLDPDALTFNDWCALEEFGFNTFRRFLSDYSKWKPAEISNLTRKEIFATWAEVQELVSQALEPPLATSAPSNDGRAETASASLSK